MGITYIIPFFMNIEKCELNYLKNIYYPVIFFLYRNIYWPTERLMMYIITLIYIIHLSFSQQIFIYRRKSEDNKKEEENVLENYIVSLICVK